MLLEARFEGIHDGFQDFLVHARSGCRRAPDALQGLLDFGQALRQFAGTGSHTRRRAHLANRVLSQFDPDAEREPVAKSHGQAAQEGRIATGLHIT